VEVHNDKGYKNIIVGNFVDLALESSKIRKSLFSEHKIIFNNGISID
jgi:hypothetical protein